MPAASPEDPAARLARLEAEIAASVAKHDLAGVGEERGDGHHHPAEAATDADMREHELRAQLRLRGRQEQIRRAREAIAAGTYGICSDCGASISEGRLRAVPDAERCVPCQTAASRRR